MTPPYATRRMYRLPLEALRRHLAAYLLIHHPGLTDPADTRAVQAAGCDPYLMRAATALAFRLGDDSAQGTLIWTILPDALRLRDQISDTRELERLAGPRG